MATKFIVYHFTVFGKYLLGFLELGSIVVRPSNGRFVNTI